MKNDNISGFESSKLVIFRFKIFNFSRFVTEFGLEQEMLGFQAGVNKVILSVNNFLGEENSLPGGSNNVDRIGVAASASAGGGSSSSSSTAQSPVLNWLTNVPQAIGGAAVAAIKFITPTISENNVPAEASDKISSSSSSSFSQINPFINLNQVAFGILGVAALGTVGYGLYAKQSNTKNRRRIYQRSIQDEDHDKLWISVGQMLLKGKKWYFFPGRNLMEQMCVLGFTYYVAL